MLAEGAGAVLDGRAVPAGAGARPDVVRRRSCWRSASTARTSRASRCRPRPSRTTPTARWPRTCSATPAQVTAADKKADPASTTPTRSGVSGLRGAVRRAAARRRRQPDRAARPAGLRRSADGADTAAGAGRHARHQHRRERAEAGRAVAGPADQRLAQGRQAGDVRRGRRDGSATPAASSPRPATRPTTRSSSSAASPTATTPRSPHPARTTRCSSRAIAGAVRAGLDVQADHLVVDCDAHEISLDGSYPCPRSLTIDGRVKTNYDCESFGGDRSRSRTRSATRATRSSTRPAANEYYADQARVDAGKKPNEYLQQMAAAFGVGHVAGRRPAGRRAGDAAPTPTARPGWRAGRRTRRPTAPRPSAAIPTSPNATDRAYLTLLASENCTDGWRYRAGDNADMAIGQGETTVSPLQLAVAYSALVNGGKIWRADARLGRGQRPGQGRARRSSRRCATRCRSRQKTLNYIANSLNFGRGWAVSGAFAYIGSPYATRIGGKTGTAEVFGKQDTSWLATWGPI